MQHSKLAPSSAARRVACPGSRALEARFPETIESAHSREGTAAHWVAQQYLIQDYRVYETTPSGEPITNEMREGADMYAEHINWLNKDANAKLHIEERVDISNIHPDCWGTPDCWYIIDEHLYIVDYKFGHGYVEVFENWQLLEYAAGIASTQKESVISEITMTIVQPRCYTAEGPIRSWTISPSYLTQYIDRLRVSEALASEENAVCVPSIECSNCLARHACTALQNTVGNIIDTVQGHGFYELDSRQTAWELKHLRQAAQLLDSRLTGLEEQAKSMIIRGEYVPGFTLEAGSGREHWTKCVEEVITLGEIMGINLAKPAEAITPVQARKLGLDDEILKSYSQRIPGKLKLVEDKNAAKVFKK